MIRNLIPGGKTSMDIAIVYILVSVIGGAVGQLLLKHGMNSMGPLTLSISQLFSILFKLGTNIFVIVGLGIYVASTVFWLTALSRVELSFAYPFASLSYIIMVIASWQLFNENLTPLRLLGTLVIACGVFLVSRT
jgi:drug/metabolite transporter (DMT)-like permease